MKKKKAQIFFLTWLSISIILIIIGSNFLIYEKVNKPYPEIFANFWNKIISIGKITMIVGLISIIFAAIANILFSKNSKKEQSVSIQIKEIITLRFAKILALIFLCLALCFLLVLIYTYLGLNRYSTDIIICLGWIRGLITSLGVILLFMFAITEFVLLSLANKKIRT